MTTERPKTNEVPRNAEPSEFEAAIAGLDYPASKDAVVRKAMDKGGLDREVPHVLGQIEGRTYESESDLLAEIERVYARGGGLWPSGPAAPA
jgi:hypothetical protein